MTTQHQRLIQHLVEVQNHPANINRDIMTIAGMMTTDELWDHLSANMRNIEAYQSGRQ